MKEELSKPATLADRILACLVDAVLIVDDCGKIIFANASAEQLFNKSFSELLNRDFGFPISPLSVQEIQILRNGVVLTFQMVSSLIKWNTSESHLLCLRDITDQKQIEAELLIERIKLEQANQENEQYASIASHDLREPVRKISIYTSWLLKSKVVQSEPASMELAEKILNSTKRMNALMDGISEFSQIRINNNQFEEVNLNEVIKEVCADLDQRITEKKAVIQQDNLPVIPAVKIYMHQLFLNLISNAIKYARQDTAPYVQITLLCHDEEQVEIIVSDNGIGFSNDYANKIFEPFSRLLPARFSGTGMGLAICKKIVTAHQGTIKVTSDPGVGSNFHITLPTESEIEVSGSSR
jgi:light-regulated signal transduction histidine kinase (bacteriophytochrome)